MISDSEKKIDNFIKLDDDWLGYDLSTFCLASHYEDVLSSVLIPHGLIKDRIEKLAVDITQTWLLGEKSLSTLCVLKGGFKFFADLLNAIDHENRTKTDSVAVSVDFIRVKSYVDAHSSGKVQVVGMDNLEILRDKDVLIVEDIVESGKTITKLLEHVAQFKPKSVKVASLLVKRTPSQCSFKPDFVGFEVPNHFLVGYALDYNDHFRDLNHICVINETGKMKYAVKNK